MADLDLTTPAAPTIHAEPFYAYHATPAVNISSLLYMRTSPRHFRHYLDHGREDTDATRLGRLVHTAILEPEKLETDFAIWTGGNKVKVPKEWKAFKAQAEAEGITIIDEGDYADAMAMRDAVLAHPIAGAYLAEPGQREISLCWTDRETGLRCKARLDLLCSAIVDLKSTLHPEPFRFGRQAANLSYHVRAAWYVDAVLATLGEHKRHVFVSVEKNPPHDVVAYAVSSEIIETGRAMYRPWLRRAAECFEADSWPGVAEEEIDLLLPSWAMGADTPDSLIVDGEEVSL